MLHRILAAVLASWLVAAPAYAVDPEPQTHGSGPVEHADSVHGEEPHAKDEGHHYDYTADDDHDGMPNWADPEAEAFVLGGIGFHALNLAILAALLWWFLRGPIGDAIRNRGHEVRKSLTDSARMRDEARQRYEGLESRLAAFEQEVAAMRVAAEADAREDERKLVERAEQEAQRISETAERNIRDELLRARVALRKDAVDLAVKLAEQTLRAQVQPDDQKRLARQFLESINRDEVNGG